MRIDTLSLRNYRNHIKFDQSFDSGINVIVGENGSGKTNILEAIHLMTTCKSLKTRYDVELCNHEKDFCTIQAQIENKDDVYKLDLQVAKNPKFQNLSSKKVKLNKLPKTINVFTGIFTSVLFTPEDIELLTRSPSRRRKYIDSVLTQVNKDYKRTLSDYQKAVRQRNKILEIMSEEPSAEGQLGFWTDKILVTGAFIQKARKELFKSFQSSMVIKAKELNLNGADLEVKYRQNKISPERLEKYEDKEILARTTLVGPHRDDFEIYVDAHNIASFGSRGQQRGFILGLKLSEIDYINTKKGERPVLLLDDIFSELDAEHKEAVSEVIKHQQTILTSTEIYDFLSNYLTINI